MSIMNCMPLTILTSQAIDGPMKSPDGDQSIPRAARIAFLERNHIQPVMTTFLNLTYGGTNYCRYLTLADHLRGDGIIRDSTIDADGLVVTRPDFAILLPLADCIGAVLHDPTQNVLMVSHLGRHNLEQNGGTESVNYLVNNHGVDPKDLTVWLSPAAGKTNYPLHGFDNRSLHEVAIEQLMNAGVSSATIEMSPIDTTTDERYFSHSEFLKGNRREDGRFAIIAVMQN